MPPEAYIMLQLAGAIAVGELRAWIPLLGVGALVHKMLSEEALMLHLHGLMYAAYASHVPWRIAPGVW